MVGGGLWWVIFEPKSQSKKSSTGRLKGTQSFVFVTLEGRIDSWLDRNRNKTSL